MADIDHFKKVNDSYGHAIGDQVLVTVGRVLRAAAPKGTFVSRSGGEEFGLILKGWTRDEVMTFCHRLCSTVARRKFKNSRIGLDLGSVTVSLGVAFASQAPCAEDLLRAADVALYKAKQQGRNQAVFFEESVNGGVKAGHVAEQKSATMAPEPFAGFNPAIGDFFANLSCYARRKVLIPLDRHQSLTRKELNRRNILRAFG